MDWYGYNYLKSLVEREMVKLENNFRTACLFIPKEEYEPNKQTGIEKAHEIFTEKHSELKKVLEQLRNTVASTYKDHPSKEMREFWGLTESTTPTLKEGDFLPR